MGSAAVQGELWGARAADWAYKAEQSTAPLWRAILGATEVGPGTRLLDMGCGAGGLSVLAVERGAQVDGLDASQALLDIAAARMPNSRFARGDLESLPYEDATFDFVIACNSIQFAEDPRRAVAEAKRVLKAGGRFAIGMWCEPERCEITRVFDTIRSLLPPPTPAANEPPPLNARGNLAKLVESAGFRQTQEAEVECPFVFESVEAAWDTISSAGILVGIVRKLGEEPARSAAMGAMEQFRGRGGEVRTSNWFRYLVAESSGQQEGVVVGHEGSKLGPTAPRPSPPLAAVARHGAASVLP